MGAVANFCPNEKFQDKLDFAPQLSLVQKFEFVK